MFVIPRVDNLGHTQCNTYLHGNVAVKYWSWCVICCCRSGLRDNTNEMGGGAQITHIHEVKDNQPLSFNHIRCRGVAARAGSVHLIYSKLGWKGEARTRPQQHHPVRPILQEISTNHQKSANNANNTHVDDIPPHPHHNPLSAWKSTSTQSTTFHILKASPPASLGH